MKNCLVQHAIAIANLMLARASDPENISTADQFIEESDVESLDGENHEYLEKFCISEYYESLPKSNRYFPNLTNYKAFSLCIDDKIQEYLKNQPKKHLPECSEFLKHIETVISMKALNEKLIKLVGIRRLFENKSSKRLIIGKPDHINLSQFLISEYSENNGGFILTLCNLIIEGFKPFVSNVDIVLKIVPKLWNIIESLDNACSHHESYDGNASISVQESLDNVYKTECQPVMSKLSTYFNICLYYACSKRIINNELEEQFMNMITYLYVLDIVIDLFFNAEVTLKTKRFTQTPCCLRFGSCYKFDEILSSKNVESLVFFEGKKFKIESVSLTDIASKFTGMMNSELETMKKLNHIEGLFYENDMLIFERQLLYIRYDVNNMNGTLPLGNSQKVTN